MQKTQASEQALHGEGEGEGGRKDSRGNERLELPKCVIQFPPLAAPPLALGP